MARGVFVFLAVLLAAWTSGAVADEQLGTIIVSKSPAQAVDYGQGGAAALGIIEGVPGVDVRARGPYGIQQDVSLRGATFEQVGAYLNGIRFNDPQTGHHTFDIPLTAYDLERVDTLSTGGIGGSIAYTLRPPVVPQRSLAAAYGQYAFFHEAGSVTVPSEFLSGRVSVDHATSNGARPNTGFESSTATGYTRKEWDGNVLDTFVGYVRKDFGASTFYSNLFPEEEEHTRTTLATTSLTSTLEALTLRNTAYWRRHDDKFILRRNNPTSVNYHTTHLYGLDSEATVPLTRAQLTAGTDVGADQIDSSNLGRHARMHEQLRTSLKSASPGRLNADVGAAATHYQLWDWRESYDAGVRYDLVKDALALKGNFAHTFRVPTYTELYYRDAANQGNPGLGIEQADTYSAGVAAQRGRASAEVEGFYRKGKNLIDWVRSSSADPWVATNLGRVDFTGVQVLTRWRSLRIGYTYISPRRTSSGFFSKYALDVLQHEVQCSYRQQLSGCDIDWQLAYNKRWFGDTYLVGNVRISRTITAGGMRWEPFFSVENLANTKYHEVPDVQAPGRWIKAGLSLEW